MVNIKFFKKNDMFISFNVKGHSNLSSYGTDIVCAAISSVTLLVLNGLVEVLKLDIKYEVQEGYVSCEIDEKDYLVSQTLIKSLYLYLEELEKQYPKNLKIKVMEV